MVVVAAQQQQLAFLAQLVFLVATHAASVLTFEEDMLRDRGVHRLLLAVIQRCLSAVAGAAGSNLAATAANIVALLPSFKIVAIFIILILHIFFLLIAF